jgi:hypothetical protein
MYFLLHVSCSHDSFSVKQLLRITSKNHTYTGKRFARAVSLSIQPLSVIGYGTNIPVLTQRGKYRWNDYRIIICPSSILFSIEQHIKIIK